MSSESDLLRKENKKARKIISKENKVEILILFSNITFEHFSRTINDWNELRSTINLTINICTVYIHTRSRKTAAELNNRVEAMRGPATR